jgi:protein-tyrosine phosphatase
MNCQECKEFLLGCTDCLLKECPKCLTRVDHFLCECGQRFTCHESRVCRRCVKPYHWITPSVVIGDSTTPNLLVDLVVDLNFPENGCKEAEIIVLGNVIRVGLKDTIGSLYVLQSVVERVMALLRETPHRKVLFRCYAGISRSVSVACWYLAETLGISKLEALELIKSKRPQAKPNTGFLMLIKK